MRLEVSTLPVSASFTPITMDGISALLPTSTLSPSGFVMVAPPSGTVTLPPESTVGRSFLPEIAVPSSVMTVLEGISTSLRVPPEARTTLPWLST